ncbi:oxygen-independent coproporphyrinogen III oxidase [Loktanella sp. R86503]|uniref:oxygen-independent coproporphyrinogen III oxidase n=1 Tax=Loktanella sp. R86503 TaxID=3093847 RepID=UPI0036DDDF3C
MTQIDLLRRHGLFDAKVPRYTSYPPANHFGQSVGADVQCDWIAAIPQGRAVSVYIHIPFCRRLCWFCACRTQGTSTMRPVDAYVDQLLLELAQLRRLAPAGLMMGRLHLGGGTPTILPAKTMARLLRAVFTAFDRADDFEFSVEIDPTDAAPDLLQTLIDFGMNRASIGVQDFAPAVQKAIGRPQSLDQTQSVAQFLRDAGLRSLNVDLLYGLPHQTPDSFRRTLDHVADLCPDRLAIYGYAHVPWMSKRQVMIKDDTLPDAMARFELAGIAHDAMTSQGLRAIGIDHFANPSDRLARADANGTLRRNFQGYTDDQSETLLGLGASAISAFGQGFVQNAVATSAWHDRVGQDGLAGQKGYVLTPQDKVVSQIIADLMCRFAFDRDALLQQFPDQSNLIASARAMLSERFGDAITEDGNLLQLRPEAKPLVRIMARHVDSFIGVSGGYSAAI